MVRGHHAPADWDHITNDSTIYILHTMAILIGYFSWHYGDGLKAVARNAVLRVLGYLRYFSVLELSTTLFSPWHRIAESYGRGFTLSRFLTSLIVNIFSRIAGAIVRSIVILMGILAGFLTALFGIAAIALWFILPIVIPGLMVIGILLASS